jgi:hypothetical protein
MIWVTWRQHRMQLLLGATALALLSAFLLATGAGIWSAFRSTGLEQCLGMVGRDCGSVAEGFTTRFNGYQFTVPLFLVVPALIGVFWGAPLVAREVESGTARLAWTQGIGRIRWAGTRIAALAGATAVGAGLLAWALSWWSRPLVAANDDRFVSGVFDLRGLVPVAYALFALAVGVAAGTLIRRTVPAMVASITTYAAVRLGVEVWVRPHYMTPRVIDTGFFRYIGRRGFGDWVLSTRTLDRAGHVLANAPQLDFNYLSRRCPGLPAPGGPVSGKVIEPAIRACIRRIGLHLQTTYQPGSRYLAFQGIESAIFVALAVGLVALSLWWVRRRLA